MIQRSKHWGILWGSLLILMVWGCDSGGDDVGPCDLTFDLLEHLRVDDVTFPTPVLDGTRFQVRGESFIAETTCVTPQVIISGGGGQVTLNVEVLSPNDLVATIPSNGAASLGSGGAFTGVMEVHFAKINEAGSFQTQFPLSFELTQNLTPSVTALAQTEAYLNDPVTLNGSGFLDGDEEGTTHVLIDGTFDPAGSDPVTVSGITLPTELVDASDRSRATFLWSPLIGGLEPGTFTGTITPQNNHFGGMITSGDPASVTIMQQDSVIFGISPEEVSLGLIVDVNGRGFIGSTDEENPGALGTTSFRLEGYITPCTGGPGIPLNCNHEPQPVGLALGGTNVELVGTWQSGTLVRYPVTVSNSGGFLHAVDFRTHRGTFEGSITPVLRFGSTHRDGISVPNLTIVLGPVRQIAWVRFLPGFSDSLNYFGLGAVEAIIRERIIAKMQGVYQQEGRESSWVNVEFRIEEPDDFYPGAYAIVDIGGPDPNSIGLFGYDNTPGKDIGNLRLWDHIGGRNAMGELDGYGYGGVFVESMLFWSEHPPPEVGERPRGAPPADPRYDEVFDPVRENEVVAGEYPNGSDPARVAQIEAAISALSNMVGDTTAHEFGHSLGLAQPFVPDQAYHNAIPQEGCLMDSGRDRPLEERMMLEDNLGARFCQENLWYLQDILSME